MTELMKNSAINIVQNNLVYLDEVVEAAIINLLEDENVECNKEFLTELQEIYNSYIAENRR